MPSPLQSLYSPVNDLPILNYPSDLGSSRKGHYISFNIMVPKKANYISDTSASPASIMPTSDISSSLASAMNSVGNAATQASSLASSVSGVTNTITDTIGSVASVANQALNTVNSVAGAAAGVVGSVAGVAGIVSSAAGATSLAGNVLGGVTAATVGVSAASNIVSGVGGALGSVGQFLSSPVDSISNMYDSIKNFLNSPDKLAADTTGGLSTYALEDAAASKFSGEFMFTPATAKIQGFINLYMPDTVSMNQHASYKDLSITDALGRYGLAKETLGAASRAHSLIGPLEQATKNGTDFGGEAFRTIGESMPSALEVGGNAAAKTGAVNNGFTQYLLGQFNTAINPQMEVLFTAMDFRVFQFDFTFTPKSPEEANTVRDIIRLFRFHAAPSLPKDGSGRYFTVPSIFNIEYRYLEQRNENLHKFAPCALTTVMVDYAPEVGWVAHGDGMPVKTRLTLQFKEMEILTQDKIQQGY